MKYNKIFTNLSFLVLIFSATLVADQKVTLQLSWLHQFQFAGFYMAEEKGFYKNAGLNVDIKEFTYDLNRATYIKEKKADFAIGRSSLLIDKANGEDVVALGAIYQKSPLMLLVTKDSGIEKISDLKNKRIMITDDAKDTVSIMAMLNSNGIKLNDIQIQNHSFNVNDLIENKTDAMASYISNEPVSLGNKNIDYKIFHPKDYGFDFYGDILYSSSQYIKNNPKLVKDFFDASLQGWKYALENTNETVEVIYNKYNPKNKTKSDLLKEANELKKLVYGDNDKIFGSLDKMKLQKIVNVYKVLGLMHKDVDLDTFIYEHNPYKTYAFELSKLEIIYLIIISISIIVLLIIVSIFSSVKSKLLVTNSQLLKEVKKSEQELDKSYETLQKLTDNMPGVIYQYRLYPDGSMTFPYVSKGTQDIWEVTPSAVLHDATSAFSRIHPDDLEIVTSTIKDSAKNMKDWELEYRVNLPKKGLCWLRGHAKPEELKDGSILWHGAIEDITDRKYTENELREQKNILYHQAHHDALTGLPNRVLFNDRLEQARETAKRNKTSIALLFIDLDHFKEINDSLGHNFGDEILKIITKRLISVTRDEDSIARLGGDEFTLILEELTDPQDASLIATKILKSLSKAIVVEGNTLYISCSIGISIYPDDGVSTQNLLKFADSAMYKAKNEGRNNFQYYNSSMTELALERVVMETALRVALQNDEFIVYYQPQVNGVTDQLIGMEALVRWQHPTMGLISPAKFIPLAESTGLIVELDRFVMKTAMTQLSLWYKDGLNPGVLAMNLAVKQLKQDDFIDTLQNLIKETKCKPEWLELEITEGQIMTNPEEAIKTLQQISDIGIELAIDDFGTGYSSLAYLKKLPINKLKIDRAFVRDLPDDEEDAAIAKAVIALAKSLNLRVIAEGVETKEQRDFIVENGGENIQGYFYSKPTSAQDIEVLLMDGLKV